MVFRLAKYVYSPNPVAARWLGWPANARARQISLLRGRIPEFGSRHVSGPVRGYSAYSLSYSLRCPGPGPGFRTAKSLSLESKVGIIIEPDRADVVWATIPLGEICSFTQQLQVVWSMPTTQSGGAQNFTVSLPSLDWVWSKVDATHWEAK